MRVFLENVAVVILSDGNNPRILNPDFLDRNAIVPPNWKADNVLVTPPFAQVFYPEGVQIFIDENKLQFTCSKPSTFDWAEGLPKIANAYTSVLPHVSYRSVGLNFTFKSEELMGEDAERKLINEFLKDGPWLKLGEGITGTVIEFQYRSSQPQMNIKIGVLEVVNKETGIKKLEGTFFNVNFHNPLQPEQIEERMDFIKSLRSRHDQFLEFQKTLPL